MRRFAESCFAVLLCLLALEAKGMPRHEALRFFPYIVNGEPVAGPSSVVEVAKFTRRSFSICSGSIISRNAVLTASHCVIRDPQDMLVGIGRRIALVRKVRIHPRMERLTGGLIRNDVAILYLMRPTSRPPLSVLVSKPPEVNDPLTLYGYGRDTFNIVGILQTGTSSVAKVTHDYIVTQFRSDVQSSACTGDSGGPAILEYLDPANALHKGIVGIVSEGTTADCGIGTDVYYTNLQAPSVLNFITSRVRAVKLE